MLATVKMAMGCIATAKILLHSPDAKAAHWSLTRLPTLAEIHSVGLPRPLLKLERQRKFSMKSTTICMLTANTVAEIQISIKCCSWLNIHGRCGLCQHGADRVNKLSPRGRRDNMPLNWWHFDSQRIYICPQMDPQSAHLCWSASCKQPVSQ